MVEPLGEPTQMAEPRIEPGVEPAEPDLPGGNRGAQPTSEPVEPIIEPAQGQSEPPGEPSFTCLECGKSFGSEFGLRGHMRLHRASSARSEPARAGSEPIQPAGSEDELVRLRAEATKWKLEAEKSSSQLKALQSQRQVQSIQTPEHQDPTDNAIERLVKVKTLRELGVGDNLGGSTAPGADPTTSATLQRLENQLESVIRENQKLRESLQDEKIKTIFDKLTSEIESLKEKMEEGNKKSASAQIEIINLAKEELVALHKKSDLFMAYLLRDKDGQGIQPMSQSPKDDSDSNTRSELEQRLENIKKEDLDNKEGAN